MMNDILVSICCITYNHEPYIKQTLDGFVNQITNFKYEVLIHDDASKDYAQNIIKYYESKYPELIKPIYQKVNQFSIGNYYVNENFNFPRAKGKYIAICEGDDYWIDNYKLQKQIDFLENNPEYGLCYTKAKVFIQNKLSFANDTIGSDCCKYEDLFIKGNDIPALTTVFRKDLLFRYLNEINPENKYWLMADLPLWLWFTKNSKVMFLEDITSVYRVLENSASHFSDNEKLNKFWQSTFDVRKFYSDLYNDKVLFKQFKALFLYKKALESHNFISLIKSSNKISFKYLKLKDRIKDFFKCSKVIYYLYSKIKKKRVK